MKLSAARQSLHPETGPRQQREIGEARAVARRRVGGGPAAERVPNQMYFAAVETIEEIEIVHREISQRCASKPGLWEVPYVGCIRNPDIKGFRRQPLEEWQPLQHWVGTVQKQDQRTRAAMEASGR